MKNQIIENDVGKAMQRKFPAVKVGRINRVPVFVIIEYLFYNFNYRLLLLKKERITFQ